jgi:hypothetical protein
MQQTNSPARQHLAMGQPNSIQAAPRKSTGQRCDLVAPVADCGRNSQPSAIVSTATRRDLHCRL